MNTSLTLEVVQVNGESRMDSRLIAKRMDLDPSNFLELLRKYQAELEKLGILPFETGEIKGRGQPEKYAMLNYDQAAFAIMLSRNTPEVVDAKLDITIAFAKARKELQLNPKDLCGIVAIAYKIDSMLTSIEVRKHATKSRYAHATIDKLCKIFYRARRDLETTLVRDHGEN